MYITGNKGNYAGRIHKLPTGISDITSFATEANGNYISSVSTYIYNKWEEELRKKKYNLTGITSYLSTQVLELNNKLLYKQSNGATTVINNPVGAYNLSAITPKVTEIYCHRAPNITSLTCTSNTSLLILDLKISPNLKTLVFSSCTNLSSVTLDSSFTSMVNITFQDCPNLITFSANFLTSVSGDLNLRSNSTFLKLAGSVSFPLLTTVGGNFYIYGVSTVNGTMTSFSAPVLSSVGGGFICANHKVLTSISCPLLATVGTDLNLSGNALLTSVNFNSVASIGSLLYINNNTNLTTFNLPSLSTYISSLEASFCSSLVIIDFGSVISGVLNWNFSGCGLTELIVDEILQAMVDALLESSTLDVGGGTNSVPSAGGLTNVGILTGAGNSITTN